MSTAGREGTFMCESNDNNNDQLSSAFIELPTALGSLGVQDCVVVEIEA